MKRIPLHTVKPNFAAFFVFGGTAASFTLVKNLLGGNQNRKTDFVFVLEVNNARTSAELPIQPIKLCDKHYPPSEYTAISIKVVAEQNGKV